MIIIHLARIENSETEEFSVLNPPVESVVREWFKAVNKSNPEKYRSNVSNNVIPA
jgi:hypothetical protein